MSWVWAIALAWLLLALGMALLIGRSISMADRKAADREAEADMPNVIVERPPLTVARPAPEPPASPAPEPPPAPAERTDPTTIPGLPAARPPVGRPPVPRSIKQRPRRRSGLG